MYVHVCTRRIWQQLELWIEQVKNNIKKNAEEDNV